MPTQEELNAAQVELDIANDNYAQMANKYNQFQDVFKLYADATPEMQAKAKNAMVRALDEFENLKLNMYAAEDRIQQAQNRVNSYNEIIANQPVQQVNTPTASRRKISTYQPVINNTSNEIPVVNDVSSEVPVNIPEQNINNNQVVLQKGTAPIYSDQWTIIWQQLFPGYNTSNLNSLRRANKITPSQSAPQYTPQYANESEWWSVDPYKSNNLRWIVWNFWNSWKNNFREFKDYWKSNVRPAIFGAPVKNPEYLNK